MKTDEEGLTSRPVEQGKKSKKFNKYLLEEIFCKINTNLRLTKKLRTEVRQAFRFQLSICQLQT